MALNIEYELRDAYEANFSGGTIRLDDVRVIDIAALLAAGSGTIVADSTDGVLIGALDAYPALIRVGMTEDPPLPIYSTTPLRVRAAGERTLDLEGAAADLVVSTDENGDLQLVPYVKPEELDEALSSLASSSAVTAEATARAAADARLAPLAGTPTFTGAAAGTTLAVTMTSPWGIEAGTGRPYYDPAGATAGEEAWPALDSSGAFSITTMKGAVA